MSAVRFRPDKVTKVTYIAVLIQAWLRVLDIIVRERSAVRARVRLAGWGWTIGKSGVEGSGSGPMTQHQNDR